MQTLTCKRSTILFIGFALIIALSVTTSGAQEKTKIAGKMTISYTKQEMIDVGDTEQHMVSLSEGEGVHVSTGKHQFMDGAQLVNISFGDLVKGNGPHQGYLRMSKKGETIFARWEGRVTTTLSPEDTPVTTFEGSFSFSKNSFPVWA